MVVVDGITLTIEDGERYWTDPYTLRRYRLVGDYPEVPERGGE